MNTVKRWLVLQNNKTIAMKTDILNLFTGTVLFDLHVTCIIP